MNGFPEGDYPAIPVGDLDFMNRPKPEPPPAFGTWLNLLAIGLTLNFIRFFSVMASYRGDGSLDGPSGTDLIAQAVVSAWALINLVAMFKRSRRFPRLMIGLLATGALFNVAIAAWDLRTTPTANAWEPIAIMVASPAVSLIWITYLLRSEHVRKVFVA